MEHQEKDITSAIKNTYNNIIMVLCKKHVTDNLSHKIKNDFLVKLLKGLTTCKKQDKFFAKNNIILVLDYFSDCNANEKRCLP